jgi:hypothetical protein
MNGVVGRSDGSAVLLHDPVRLTRVELASWLQPSFSRRLTQDLPWMDPRTLGWHLHSRGPGEGFRRVRCWTLKRIGPASVPASADLALKSSTEPLPGFRARLKPGYLISISRLRPPLYHSLWRGSRKAPPALCACECSPPVASLADVLPWLPPEQCTFGVSIVNSRVWHRQWLTRGAMSVNDMCSLREGVGSYNSSSENLPTDQLAHYTWMVDGVVHIRKSSSAIVPRRSKTVCPW